LSLELQLAFGTVSGAGPLSSELSPPLHPASEIAEATAKTWTSQLEGERPAHTFDIVSSVIDVLILSAPQARRGATDHSGKYIVMALFTIRPKSNPGTHLSMRRRTRARILFDQSLMHRRDTRSTAIATQ
jgi:hypothetical protein